jgi:1,4-dihydroxy-2-naphthoate octaprenyltransferase
LPAAIAPVLIGTAAAYELDSFRPVNAVLAALVALLLQIGVNFANDYSDGVRGTAEDRVGPLRLVGSGAAQPEHVKYAAFGTFALAMLFGLALVLITQSWWLILVGIGCVMAAWGYTGGKNPYGYMGLGDVFVFVFFGLVATLGTTYTQAGQISLPAVIGAIGTGLIACALLMANNVRDIPTDIQAGFEMPRVRRASVRITSTSPYTKMTSTATARATRKSMALSLSSAGGWRSGRAAKLGWWLS